MDAFARLLFGALAAMFLWVWLLGRYFLGSGLEQLGLRPRTRADHWRGV